MNPRYLFSLINRRQVLKGLFGAGLSVGTGACFSPNQSRSSQPSNPVVLENQKEGTRDWMLKKTGIDPSTRYRCPWIEGYCSQTRYRAGDKLQVKVSTRPTSGFLLDIYRLGYYAGKGGRHMGQWGPFNGRSQDDPAADAKRRLDCQWETSFEHHIPADWVSGVYLIKLTSLKEGFQSYAIFILRDDRKADFMFQCSDHTWQAYNRWPDQFSLYDNGQTEWYWGGGIEVSFNRPYGKYCQILDAPLSTGSGEFLLWEFPTAFWMESLGYDVTYTSNQDTHSDAPGLRRCKSFLSVGHDEYWTLQMFRNVQQAIKQGMHAAFLSGNAVCGKIHLQRDRQGNPDRVMERIGVFGPPGGTREFNSMSKLIHEPPYASELMGAQSTGPVTGGADWICRKPDHWIFDGTEMSMGDAIPGLVGWEWHGDPAGIDGLEILASGKTQSAPGILNGGEYTSTIYQAPKGNWVFNAATIWWGDGLSEPPGYVRPSVYTSPEGPDTRLQKITRNLFDRMKS
ncbi:MAG: hypothetical protein HN758_15200 [Verrucomicrobia bacterium]|nr:hypothetical protein [Verrucomicrobiota bacterium]